GIVAMLDEKVVDFEIGDVRSGAATVGHRFRHPGPITLGGASDYLEKLKACHVIVDQDERARIIREGAAAAASAAGLTLVEDEGLVLENAGLTEWPVPLLGRFDPSFLQVPREVIQLTMRTNQKYFALNNPPRNGEGDHSAAPNGGGAAPGSSSSAPPLRLASGEPPPRSGEDQGSLAPAFICVANIDPADGGQAIVHGNQKVLAARLSDAKFFWEHDLKVPLEEQAQKLSQIVFHEKLGTVADKVDRVAKLARWLVEDEGLVLVNDGLTEWPVPLLGRFDPSFLQVPREVIQLTMRTNQKYFALNNPPRNGEGDHSAAPNGGGAGGDLAPAFICVANSDPADGGEAIVHGNQKVLAARLSDAKFFWEHDLKVPLEEQAKKLSQIVFHERLGTVADKVDRVAKLARWLVEENVIPAKAGISLPSNAAEQGSEIPASAGMTKEHLADLAERAARLAKADLVTQMVGEFPELQGLIGGYIAAAQGEDPSVAEAIRDHYKPVGQGDEVPTAPVTVAVSLADKLDTLASFFHPFVRMEPTGSKDPFALRRAALGVISVLVEQGLRLSIGHFARAHEPVVMDAIRSADFEAKRRASGGGDVLQAFGVVGASSEMKLETALGSFFADRLKVQQREAGVRHDLIDAVFALGGEDDLVRLLARVRALQSFVETPEGADLLAGYKRAANILKKENWTAEQGANKKLSYTPENAETALIAALDSAEPEAAAAVEREDFEGAMRALATLRSPVDAFFNEVTVNDPDEDKRAARLNLLGRMRSAVHRVADFSRIEG
ncbi:MAG: glycine--tRNA ligase subunit beta, partial [Alphaproteobacteria bacterium]|nr:glycine--tRNA ligase subunit beta [Alphaproteobacteria bacterium]